MPLLDDEAPAAPVSLSFDIPAPVVVGLFNEMTFGREPTSTNGRSLTRARTNRTRRLSNCEALMFVASEFVDFPP